MNTSKGKKNPQNKNQKIEYGELELDKFSTFGWNPKKVDPEKYERLKKNIEKIGIIEPVKVRDTALGKFGGTVQIWDGKQRYKIAKELGIEKIPYINYGEMDYEETQMKRIGTEFRGGKIDEDMIREELWRRVERGEDCKEVKLELGLFGKPTMDIEKGVEGYREKHEGAGQKVNEDVREKVEMFDWSLISELPEDKKVKWIEKRASNEATRVELAEEARKD